MSEFQTEWEVGDFLVEFAGVYLGEGAVVLQMAPSFLEVRQDALQILQARRVKGVALRVNADLTNAPSLFDVLQADTTDFTLATLAGSVFTSGGVLKLYPADPKMRGYEFKRAFCRNSERRSGAYLETGDTVLSFDCEADAENGIYFSRLAAGARPGGLAERTMPDGAQLTRELIHVLAGPLNALADRTLCRGRFAPDPAGSYGLFLDACSDWEHHAPRRFEYTLIGRFPMEQKDLVDQRLSNAANLLHGMRPALPNLAPLACKVRRLAFDGHAAIFGRQETGSELNFSVLMI